MCNAVNCRHEDLNDDLEDIFGAYVPGEKINTDLARAQRFKMQHEEPCRACRGSGKFVSYSGRTVGDCFKCKGSGKLVFSTSLGEREKAKAQRDARKAREAVANGEQATAWLEANPVEAEWLRRPVTGDFTFHADMLAALVKYGSLTEKQEAAVRNGAAKSAARKAQWVAEKATREAGAPVLTMDKIRAGFDSASQHLKRPKLRIADIQFSLAPATGRNAGAIYVVRVSDDIYLGKITQDDKFITSRDCTSTDSETVASVAADPAAAASAHGHNYGQCSCCGRELTNAESVSRGIGPICAERWGW